MKNRRVWLKVTVVVLLLVVLGYGMQKLAKVFTPGIDESDVVLTSKNSILQLDLTGVIMNGKKFLKRLDKYKDESNVKAILININSPGGAVGPSQEVYMELMRAKNETKKPLVCVSTNLIASGAYYAAMACDKLVVTPGALVGSIGVIMEFANLEKLYDWAHVSRYAITSGKFKDTGAEYRAMRDDEKQLFQDMINDVYAQFRDTVKEGRKLSDEMVTQYADGRVFTGQWAVKNKFADQEGTYRDAVRLAAEMAGLGDDYKVFDPNRKKSSFWDFIREEDDDDLNSISDEKTLASQAVNGAFAKKIGSVMGMDEFKKIMRLEFLNRPMLIMPGIF